MLIDRDAAIEAMGCIIDSICEQQAVDALLDLPTIDPVKRGRWVKAEKGGEWWYACSICEGHIPKTLWGQDWHSSYCPNCGALMREGGEEDE